MVPRPPPRTYPHKPVAATPGPSISGPARAPPAPLHAAGGAGKPDRIGGFALRAAGAAETAWIEAGNGLSPLPAPRPEETTGGRAPGRDAPGGLRFPAPARAPALPEKGRRRRHHQREVAPVRAPLPPLDELAHVLHELRAVVAAHGGWMPAAPAVEVAAHDHRPLRARQPGDGPGEAVEDRIHHQIELDVRRVERDDALAPPLDFAADRRERVRPREVPDHRDHQVPLLHLLHEPEVLRPRQVVRLPARAVPLEQELPVR